jgi:hypothetical protein
MSDMSNNVTTFALLNLIRLLAGELVAGAHRDDVTQVISAIDRQLDATPLPRGIDVNDARHGIAHARVLLSPYIARVRELAATRRARDQAATIEAEREGIFISPRPRYLQ